MIAVYMSPESMTVEQYNKIHQRLEAAGAPDKGRTHHSCFGEDGHLMVFDIWETQDDFEAFGKHLVPILEAEGIKTTRPPDIMPVVNLIQ
jgi:hypothetical protein